MIKIKDIFLPTHFNSYYFFSERIIAFEVGSSVVRATIMRAHRSKRTIQKFIEEPYTKEEPNSLIQAIKNIVIYAGTFDSAYVALPSNGAIFKKISVPFVNLEKIKLILPFEVESLLPFPLNDAIIDAIINKSDKENNKSDIFVVAMQKDLLDSYIMPFIEAGVRPSKVTLGIIELYGFTEEINQNNQQNKLVNTNESQNISALIDLDTDTTRILIAVNNQIKTIRILQQGIDPELMRLDLGIGQNLLSKDSEVFFSKIQFTIQATLKNENIKESLKVVLISGIGSQINGITDFIAQLLGCSCQVLQPHKIIHNGTTAVEDNASIPINFTTSIATALSSKLTKEFNLGKIYNAPEELNIFKKQITTSSVLIGILVISISLYGFLNINNLKKEIDQSKEQTITRLIQEFNLTIPGKQKKSLATVINTTQQKLILEESIWFALSTFNRFSFLHYLQELTTRIDRDALGLQLKRLVIKSDERSGEDSMILEGSVNDYDALRALEDNLLDSQLFTMVPKLQETKFNISLVVNKNGKGT